MTHYICSYHKNKKNSPLTCFGYLPLIFEVTPQDQVSNKCKISQECKGLYYKNFLLTKTVDFTL